MTARPASGATGGEALPPPDARTFARSALAGALMGLANLVPGVSGGTMLLAAGVYPRFIAAVAELTRLRFRPASVAVLATIIGAGAVAILLLAGPTKDLVVDRRWVMYSLFIGLTLGGVPIVWRLARPPSRGLWTGAAGGIALMLVVAWMPPPMDTGSQGASVVLFLSGLAGASAMILPGVSGGYLLLLLGQYVPILSAVDTFKIALLGGGGFDLGLALAAARVLVPVGVGVAAGVLGVSNLLAWLLARFRQPTLGFLLGLLLGAVFGLWPFQRPVAPEMGQMVKGIVVTPETLPRIDPEDYPLERFEPTAGQAVTSVALIAIGFGVTVLIGRLRRGGDGEGG